MLSNVELKDVILMEIVRTAKQAILGASAQRTAVFVCMEPADRRMVSVWKVV